MSHWIQTFTGRRVNVFDPRPDSISLLDIAVGLSHTCRFAGQIPWHYSVAQHSLIMSYRVPRECALEALLHDAAEAYLGDVPKPIKEGLPDYRLVSGILELAIADRFAMTYPWPAAVHEADIRMVLTEAQALGRNTTGWGVDAVPYADQPIIRMEAAHVREEFLGRAIELTIERYGGDTAWKGDEHAR